MAQVSFGTITITDTNDIERIYIVYAKSTNNTTAPSAAANTWTESIATAPGSGDYIWQRTAVKKSGVNEITYGNPICVTGPEGDSARNIIAVTPYYYLSSSNSTQTGGEWSTTPASYPATGTYYYWTKTITTYDSGSPTESTPVLDMIITNAAKDARDANATASDAWNKADGAQTDAGNALSIANSASALATGINQHFWSLATDTATTGGTLAAGQYITDVLQDTFKQSPGTYGNLLLRSDGVYLNLGLTILASFTGTALNFYNPQATSGQNSLQLSIGANGTLQSGNYVRGSNSKFAQAGTKIDLTAGDIITQYFRLSQGGESGGPTAGAYIYGTIEALSGRIGGYTDSGSTTGNYWDIGNFTDYNLQRSAKMIGHGSSFIQLGDDSTWRLATNRIHTGWYASGDSYLHFPVFTIDGSSTEANKRRWDYGIHVPTSYNDKFLYIRTADYTTDLSNLLADLEDTNITPYWTYKFWIDGEGKVHAPGFYIGDSTTPIGGGAGTIAEKLLNGAGSSTQPVYFRTDTNHVGELSAVSWDVNNSINASSTTNDNNVATIGAIKTYVTGRGYVTSSGVTSVRVQATSPVVSSTNTAQTSTLNTTISLVDGYGDTKNPYGTKTANYVLAGPITGSAAAPTFRALVAADIPDLSGTYLTSYTETDPIFVASAAHGITSSDINNWNSKTSNTGTVTSVAASGNNGITISGSPITTSGTITIGLNLSTAINTLTEGTAAANRNDYIVAQYTNGGTTTTTYHRRKLSNIFKALNSSDITTALGYTPYNSTNPNGYTNNTGTVIQVSTGAGLTGGDITTTGTIKANLTSETQLSNAALSVTEDANRIYPIRIDKNNKMVVVVPWTNVNANYLTGITSSDVTTALGYTPYNSTNPNGYTSNTGTVTSVKVQGSNGLTGSGTVTTSGTITISHSTSSQASSSNSGRTYIQSITLDDYGHITGISTASETVTDTHNTAYLYVGASNGSTNAQTTNGNTYLILVDGGSATTRRKISGSGTVSVASDNSGNITITGSAHPTTLPNPKSLTVKVYNGSNTSSDITYAGGEANNSTVSVAGSGAITAIDINEDTLSWTKADGTTGSSTVTITASVASGATILTDSEGHGIEEGNASTPVYFSGGVPVALTSSTKINYNLLPTGTTASTIAIGNHTHAISLATDTGTTDIVNLSHGGKYKLTAGGNSVIFTLPADNNTDTKVKLTSQSTSGTYPLIFGPTSITTGTTYEAFYNTGITVNPSTSTITATNFSGNASTATTATTASKLGTTNVGSSTKPIYLAAGAASECSTYAGGTAVTLNGTSKAASTASFYAPTDVGTANYVLVSNGTGAPTWTAQSNIHSGNTDEKLAVSEVTTNTTYYPIVGTGTTATTRQYDTTGFKYKGVTGSTTSIGSASLELGNLTASGTAGNKRGQLIIYGTNTKKATITLAAPSTDIALALPTSEGTIALTNQIPSSATSHATGITIADHSTTSVGSASGWNAGTASTWAFTGVTVANSISGAIDSTDNSQLNITLGTTTVQSKTGGENSTVPSLTITSTTVVNGKTHSITDNGHTHTLS